LLLLLVAYTQNNQEVVEGLEQGDGDENDTYFCDCPCDNSSEIGSALVWVGNGLNIQNILSGTYFTQDDVLTGKDEEGNSYQGFCLKDDDVFELLYGYGNDVFCDDECKGDESSEENGYADLGDSLASEVDVNEDDKPDYFDLNGDGVVDGEDKEEDLKDDGDLDQTGAEFEAFMTGETLLSPDSEEEEENVEESFEEDGEDEDDGEDEVAEDVKDDEDSEDDIDDSGDEELKDILVEENEKSDNFADTEEEAVMRAFDDLDLVDDEEDEGDAESLESSNEDPSDSLVEDVAVDDEGKEDEDTSSSLEEEDEESNEDSEGEEEDYSYPLSSSSSSEGDSFDAHMTAATVGGE